MFKIDGTEYDGTSCIVDGISETFTLLEGISSQRLQSNQMWYDIVGTEVSHTVTLRRGNTDPTAWNALWAILRTPTDSHSFEFPGLDAYDGHVSSGTRALDFIDNDGNTHWGDYSITITPMSPQITNS